ncbi:MAG: two-component system cell cycle sensor histidine kinase/response regulator CckA, partial [Chlamydiales bacterium]
ETKTVPVALGPLIHEVLGLAASSLGHKTHMEFDDQSENTLVRADASQLRQVVLNLVTNGSQALAGRAGRVRLTLTNTSREATLAVHDEGPGMDEATRDRVFEPFFSTKTHGRGLGLASALGIVRAHDGSLVCESSPGQGTTFTLRLPRCGEDGTEPDGARGRTGGARTILVADDHEAVRKLARHVLEPTGHRVIEACDGTEALALARKHASELDLLLLDVRMPGMNGDEVLEILRAEGADCPAILSSGYTQQSIDALVPAGVGFLKKPYRPAELLAAVLSARGV